MGDTGQPVSQEGFGLDGECAVQRQAQRSGVRSGSFGRFTTVESVIDNRAGRSNSAEGDGLCRLVNSGSGSEYRCIIDHLTRDQVGGAHGRTGDPVRLVPLDLDRRIGVQSKVDRVHIGG